MAAPSPAPTIDPDFQGHFIFWVAGGCILVGIVVAVICLKLSAWMWRACARKNLKGSQSLPQGRQHVHRGVTGLEKLVLPEMYEEEGRPTNPGLPKGASDRTGSEDAGIGPGFGPEEEDSNPSMEDDLVKSRGGGAYLARWDPFERSSAAGQGERSSDNL